MGLCALAAVVCAGADKLALELSQAAEPGGAVFAPEAFSLKMLPQPAACSSAICRGPDPASRPASCPLRPHMLVFCLRGAQRLPRIFSEVLRALCWARYRTPSPGLQSTEATQRK